jgi:hypothetical protein
LAYFHFLGRGGKDFLFACSRICLSCALSTSAFLSHTANCVVHLLFGKNSAGASIIHNNLAPKYHSFLASPNLSINSPAVICHHIDISFIFVGSICLSIAISGHTCFHD